MAQTNPRGRILIVDDEVELMKDLCELFSAQGFHVVGVTSPTDALAEVKAGDFNLLLSDLMLGEADGIQLLRDALAIDPDLVGILMTGQGTIPTAIAAMKAGALDYVLKPFRLQQVLPVLDRGMEISRLRRENVRLRRYVEQLAFESPRYRIIGDGPAMRKIIAMIEKVAPTDATVLVRGPSGTGKELVARALHGNSQRKDRPLVTINCATLQEHLLESELFGHEKGSFTGADKAKSGLFEVAEGGTLFIDEVAEMPAAMQAKLLRVLEDGHYRRVGGTKEQHADVRIIAATNKPLEEEQKVGRFREDLYYRLNVITIALPALKDRREDIPALVDHLLNTRRIGKQPYIVESAAQAVLMNYDWPGNIRELANVLERAQILAEGNTITLDDLPDNLVQIVRTSTPVDVPASPLNLDATEKRQVLEALRQFKGNKVHAAKALGVSRRTLYRLIEKHHLDEFGFGGEPPPATESTAEPE